MKRILSSSMLCIYAMMLMTGCVSFQSLLDSEQYSRAEAVAINESNAKKKHDYCVLLGDSYLQDGKHKQAYKYYMLAEDADGVMHAADQARERKAASDALEYYSSAQKLYAQAGDQTGLRVVADAYLKMGKYAHAILALGDAGERDGYSIVAGKAFADKRYDIASEYYARAKNTAGLHKLAVVFLQQKNYKESARHFAMAGEKNTLLADTALKNGDLKIAVTYYSSDRNTEGLISVANAHLKKKEYSEARTLYTSANYEGGLVKIADQAMSFGDYAAAGEYYGYAGLNDRIKQAGDAAVADRKYELAESLYGKADYKMGLQDIADAAYSAKDYASSRLYFEKAGDDTGIRKTGDMALDAEEYDVAGECYLAIKYNDGLNRVAAKMIEKGDYQGAYGHYTRTGNKAGLKKAADMAYEHEDYSIALDAYQAVADRAGIDKAIEKSLENGHYEIAGEYYKKIKHMAGVRKVADLAIEYNDYSNACALYSVLNDKEGLLKTASLAKESHDYEVAILCYERAGQQDAADTLRKATIKADSFVVVDVDLSKDKSGLYAFWGTMSVSFDFFNNKASTSYVGGDTIVLAVTFLSSDFTNMAKKLGVIITKPGLYSLSKSARDSHYRISELKYLVPIKNGETMTELAQQLGFDPKAILYSRLLVK